VLGDEEILERLVEHVAEEVCRDPHRPRPPHRLPIPGTAHRRASAAPPTDAQSDPRSAWRRDPHIRSRCPAVAWVLVASIASHILRDASSGTAPLLWPLPSLSVSRWLYYAGELVLLLATYFLAVHYLPNL